MRVAVYTIVKNEVAALPRWVAAAAPADVISITDTGSTDGTVALAQSLGIATHTVDIEPFDFAAARNAALANLPADVDVCLSVDADEELQPGWREILEQEWNPRLLLSPTIDTGSEQSFRAPRIHRRALAYWKDAIHEYLEVPGATSTDSAIRLVHRQDRRKSRAHYLELLERAHSTDPTPRITYYYARELFYRQRYPEARARFEQYLADPAARFRQERAHACLYLARMFPDEEQTWLLRSVAECPAQREAYWRLTLHYHRAQRWPLVFAMGLEAANQPPIGFFPEVVGADWEIADLLALAAYHLGFKAGALGHGRHAVDLSPEDPRLRSNLQFYLQMPG